MKKKSVILKILYILLIIAFLYSPILLLIYRSFDFPGENVFSAYKDFFVNQAAKEALKNSVIIAVISSCISTVIGTAAAVGISKYQNKKIKSAIMLVTNIPMTSPDIVMAVSLVLLFGLFFASIGMKDFLGLYTLLIAHITFEIPYVILSVLPKIKQMDQHLPQAAMDLGCTPLRAFFKVELPAIRTGVFTGFFMAFTLSIDDFVISRFTAGSFNTLPLFIYSAARKGVPDYIYALSAIIFVVVLLVLVIKNLGNGNKKANERTRLIKKALTSVFVVILGIFCVITMVLPLFTQKSKQTLRVFNWGEYISDGEDGTLDVISQFEKETGIDVEYMTYANNEELYAMLTNGGTTYDVILPSDYMFERLLTEGLLQEINYDNIPNYKNISDIYKGIFPFDIEDKYSIPYTVGMVGVIYNTEYFDEDFIPSDWDLLWDENYDDEILMFDNPRDAFAISQFKLGIDINSTDLDDWKKAADELKAQKSVLKRYVNDEIFDIMQDGNAAVATYYAGDFLTMKDKNDALEFYYPRNEKGELITNQFIDVMCISKDCTNTEQAEMFINFMLRDDIALANAEYICYATPNQAVLDNPDYSYTKENDKYVYDILYPPELDGTKPFNEKLMFRHQGDEIINTMNYEWSSVKSYGVDASWLYIICAIIIFVLALLMVYKLYKKKKTAIDDTYYNIVN